MADHLSMIIAQRLVRKLCFVCKQSKKIKGEGCSVCRNGFIGQTVVTEVLPINEATSEFIALARLQASDEETDMYKRIARIYLDTVNDPTGETRESNLREATQNIIDILQQEDILPKVKQDLLNEEIRKASDFAKEEVKRMLKFIGKAVLVAGSVVAKVAAALALLG